MKVSPIAIGSVLLVGVGALVTSYLWMMHGPVKSPDRPPAVPLTAVWVGLNKGEWIDCTVKNRGDGMVQCVVYSDIKGEKLSAGTYLWKSASGKAVPAEVRLTGFDGETIFAEDAKLIPIGRHVRYGHGNDSWTKDYPTPTENSAKTQGG